LNMQYATPLQRITAYPGAYEGEHSGKISRSHWSKMAN